jgi:surfactin synthase thioesterase subunit
MKKLKLFCLPYAGGSAVFYSKWNYLFPDHIEINAVELAGRGRRCEVPLYSNLTDAVDDVYNFLKSSILNNEPYALFGHSMGALISYELSRKIKARNELLPLHLFISGREAPDIVEEKMYHNMSYEQFKKEVMNLGGTPPEFFEYEELADVFLTVLRNDFRIAETHKHIDRDIKIDTDITVFYGNEDIEMYDVIGWRNHTQKKCKIYEFNGDHFFINDNLKQITNIICKTLENSLIR